MRSILCCSLLIIFSLSFTGTKQTAQKENKLNGTWVPVAQEFGGTVLPKGSFETQQLIINDNTYLFSAESIDKGTLSYRDGRMDIYGKEGVNTGKHFSAIYKYENEELTICYNLTGNGYPEVFSTKGNPMFFLSVYKKGVPK